MEKSGADMTVVCCQGDVPVHHQNAMLLQLDADHNVQKIHFADGVAQNALYSLGITIVRQNLLLDLVTGAYQNELNDFYRDIVAKSVGKLKITGYVHEEFAAVMDGIASYRENNFALLDPQVRQQLFCPERPIYTKTREDMPTRYGTRSVVKNSIVGDGCVIDGTVKNSILFRGVHVGKGAVVENCILMQDVCVGQNAELCYVISDKDAVIGSDITLKGTAEKSLVLKKNQII